MDETLLLLWFASLGMGVVALAWMTGLILARVIRTRTEVARDADRILVRDACLKVLALGPEAAGDLVALKHRPRLIAEVLMDFLSLVRGSEFSDLIDACQLTGIDDSLRDRLFSGSRAGRLAAIESLVLFPGPQTVAALKRVLNEVRDIEICLAVLRTLVELHQAPPLRYLIWAFSNTPVASAEHMLITRQAIAQQPDVALEMLEEGEETTPRARILLADGLAAAGDYRSVLPLGQLCCDADAVVRTEAVRALGMLGHPISAPILIKAMNDENWEVRVAAVESGARIGGPEFVPAMTRLLSDPVWWVRFQAGEALTQIGPAGVNALVASTQDGDEVTRHVATLALAEKSNSLPRQLELAQ